MNIFRNVRFWCIVKYLVIFYCEGWAEETYMERFIGFVLVKIKQKYDNQI
jgi:hypothetical protein